MTSIATLADRKASAAFLNTQWMEVQDATLSAAVKSFFFGVNLMRAKQALSHGELEPFIEKHCSFSYRQARKYMQAARTVVASLPQKHRAAIDTPATPDGQNGLAGPFSDSLTQTVRKTVAGRSLNQLLIAGTATQVPEPSGTTPAPRPRKTKSQADADDAAADAHDLGSRLDKFFAQSRHTLLDPDARRLFLDQLTAAARDLRGVK